MTDTSKPEELSDADLDGAQGGLGKQELQRLHKTGDQSQKGTLSSRDGAEPYIGETEKGIVAQGGDGSI